jgi:hypothetical protein
MRFVQVRAGIFSHVEVFRDENVGIDATLPQHGVNLPVRQVLQDLANETQFARGKLVFDNIQAGEADLGTAEPRAVVGDEGRYYVDPRVLEIPTREQALTDPEISAAQIY